MGNLTSWLNSLPAWALALVLCAFFLTITLAGIVLIHPLMRRAIHSERQANDVVIFAAANYGLIYAVLLGLLTVATFQTTKDLEDHIGEKASSLSAMYHTAEDYPEPLRGELRAALRDYTHYVIEKDWPAHRLGKTPKRGEHRLEAVRHPLRLRAREQDPSRPARRNHPSIQYAERRAGAAIERRLFVDARRVVVRGHPRGRAHDHVPLDDPHGFPASDLSWWNHSNLPRRHDLSDLRDGSPVAGRDERRGRTLSIGL
jgi:hypothetical protein